MNLRRKIILILVLLTIVPLFILGTTANYIATNVLEEKITFLANKTLENLTVYISKDIQNFTSLAFYCSRNSEIINSLADESGQGTLEVFYKIKRSMTKSDVIRQVNYPFQYIVVSPSQTMYTSFIYYRPDVDSNVWEPKFVEQAWYRELRESHVNMLKIVKGENELFSTGDNQIYFASNIIHDFDNIGTVLIGVDEYVFSRLLKNSKITKGSSIFIYNTRGELIVEGENNPLSSGAVDNVENRAADSPSHILVHNKRYVVTTKSVDFRENNISWRVVMLTPEAEIGRDVNKISYMLLSLLAFCVGAIVVLNFLVNRVFINPILSLNQLTTEVSKGNLHVRAHELRNDEIGRLGHGFNEMIDSLKSYIASIERQEKEKRKLEIRILQNQINPHFLHNTLNTVKWMAELKRAQGISRAIVSMSRLLDYNFSSTENIVSIRDELAYTNEYLHLQKLRYQHKFSVSCDVTDEILDCLILKCTFQPIIENSIVHGFKAQRGRCTIQIQGFQEGNNVVVLISDNGAGMDRETLDHLFDGESVLDSEDLRGIALANIQQRLQLYFGEQYGMNIESAPGEGTSVRIVLPIIHAKEQKVRE